MTTRLAIFSDIHANFPAMGEVASHIRDNDYDGVYCLGDLGGYASEPNETCDGVTDQYSPPLSSLPVRTLIPSHSPS